MLGIYGGSGNGVLDRDLRLVARALAGTAALAPDALGAARAAALVERLNREASEPEAAPGDLAWQLWTRDGRLLARSADALPALAPPQVSTDTRALHAGWMVMAAWSDDGAVYAVAGYSHALMQAVQREVWLAIALPTLCVMGTLLLALAVATRVGLKPLRTFAQRIEDRAPQALQPLHEPHAPMEMQPVVAAMNGLLSQLRGQRESEQRFFADAAHELRTPLSAINAQAHRLANAEAAEQRQHALHALQQGVDRAAQSLDKVLALARAEAQSLATEAAPPLALDVALRDAMLRHADRALHSGHDLGLGDCAPCRIAMPAELLQAVLDNLLDNALRYTPAGTRIDVQLQRTQDAAVLVVEDGGSGIAPDEEALVFERFRRGRSARDLTGSGLGLAVVAQALRACGGSVALTRSHALGGACFALRWPLAPESAP